MRVIKLVILCTFVLCFAAFGRSARAQSTTGSVVGSIADSTGSVIPNATITLTNNATGDKRTVITADSGDYQFLSIPPGEYTLTVEAQGFRRYTHNPVEVQVELATRENVDMSVGSATEQITVTSQAPIIQSENAALGQVVQGKAVTDNPLNGRNVLVLVGLVPGVVPQGSSGGNLTGQNVFAAGNYQIGGGSANQSATLYDGAPANISYGNITALVPSQDTVQEFRVQTNNNTAEYGNYTGGVINITSRSGSNAIHGTAYEFVRNTIFNSTPYFSKHNPAQILGKNPYHQNQFGGNIGFPMIKDRLFGFFDYQGYRQSQQRLYNYTVPTLKMRQGDFSELCTAGLNPVTNTCALPPRSDVSKGVPGQIHDPCGGTAAGARLPGLHGSAHPLPWQRDSRCALEQCRSQSA